MTDDSPSYEALQQRVQRLEAQLQSADFHESRERYKSLFDQNHSVMLLIDPETADIVDANAAALSFYGWTREEILGMKITDINALSREDVFLEMSRAKKEKRTLFQFIHRLAGGELRDVEVYSGPILLSGKRLLYSVIHDITDRKRLEKELDDYRNNLEDLVKKRTRALAHSMSRTQSLFISSSNGIAFYKPVEGGKDFEISDVNPSVERIEKVKALDIIGKRVSRVFPGVEQFGLLAVFRRVLESGVPEHYPVRMYQDDRIKGWRENYIFRLPSNEIAAVYRDVTKQKQAEEKLKKAHDFFQTVIDGVDESLMVVNKDFTISLANRSALDAAGLENLPEGMTCHQLSHNSDTPCQGDCHMCTLREVIRTGNIRKVEHVHKDKKGGKKIVQLVASPIFNDQGDVIQVIEVARDISESRKAELENKKLQERLQQTQKMEAIGTLAGGIAHDFNNILAGIFGFAQLAQNRLRTHDPVKADAYIEKLLGSARRAKDLVRQILTFSRQTEYEKKPMVLNYEVKETLNLLRASIPSTIDIRSDIRSSFLVLADATRIHQAILNLCTNAYQSMQLTGGELFVGVQDKTFLTGQKIGSQTIPSGNYVRLEVRDKGHGMSPEIQKRAFDPYYTTKNIGHGTGLGLSLVQAIVDEHGAFLDLASTPGQGTRFYLYFPAADNYPVSEPFLENDWTPALTGSGTIMVVEDEAPLRQVYSELLSDSGYGVICFDNGLKALDTFKKDPGRFDLVITDATMPGLTGDRLCKAVLDRRPDMPIILCTGFSEQFSRSEAMAMGISKYVRKPLENKVLLDMVNELLG